MTKRPEDCVICTDKLGEEKALECGHYLHLACVKKHFKPECPLCRAPLNIQVTGTKPIPYIPHAEPVFVLDGPPVRTQAGWFMARFSLIPVEDMIHQWDIEDSYQFPEEDPDYDEENPYGDNYDYPDEDEILD